MQLFYCKDWNEFAPFSLEEDEAIHVVQVLRKKVGDSLYIMDGVGSLIETAIVQVSKKGCILEFVRIVSQQNPSNFLQIAISPTKNMSRIEFFVEKACEIGVSKISFIDFVRTERSKVNLDRIQKIALAACKQSKQLFLPTIEALQSFDAFMKQDFKAMIWICNTDMDEINQIEVKTINESHIVIVGPEGDFTPEEVQKAKSKGAVNCTLGKSILRVETAGIVAVCHYNQSLSQIK